MVKQGDSGRRVAIANRADGGVLYWVGKLYGFAILVILSGLCVTGLCTYGYFAKRAPQAPDLAEYASHVPGVSRVYAADGLMLAEFATEWREIVPFEEIPEPLAHAFLAAEDHRFFEHNGLDFKGIARAAWRNVTAGDFAQGGSTITQQVAKQFLSSEKSLTRKAKEAIMARRLEATYSKRAILSVYLNQIYLGNGAYGVAAAARRYFQKDLDELTLAESALIAGLAQAPSRYSPTANPELARERRDEILSRMIRYGFIDEAAGAEAQATEVMLNPYRDRFGDFSPYFTEHIRRYVESEFGSEALFEKGLRIETTIEPVTDAMAYDNIAFGTRKQDKRQGWRGSVAYLDGDARDIFLERAAERYDGAPLRQDRRYLALVTELGPSGATVMVGSREYDLPLSNMNWASKWSATQALNDIPLENATEALREGDVVWVATEVPLQQKFKDWFLADGVNPRWSPPLKDGRLERALEDAEGRIVLDQVAHPQGAMLTADLETGYVVAMVGGTDFDRSEYNRTIQACRQPGSTFKPIYYSAALDMGYGFDTALNDIATAEIDPVSGEIWTPENLGGSAQKKVSLEYALTFSKNVPSVAVFKKVGTEAYEAWAKRLGFTTDLVPGDCRTKTCTALALGAACTMLDELTRAFALFARNGRWIDWIYVKRVIDRDGNVLQDKSVYYDPSLPPPHRIDRLAQTAGNRPAQAIPARAAYLTTQLLKRVIENGFSSVVRQTNTNAAGKTGTSSATMDTSFVGFTSRWITSVWLGDDLRRRPLGKQDAAYMTVVPLWARYMAQATEGHPNAEVPFEVPSGVDPKDRGDNKGETLRMPLLYRKKYKPPEEEGALP